MHVNSPEAEQYALKTDGQRAGLIQSMGKENPKEDSKDEKPDQGNAVEKEIERKEEVSEVCKLWDRVWQAVNAAREVAEKRAEAAVGKDDAVQAFRDTLGELLTVLESMKNEDDPFAEMKEKADSTRLPQ